MQVISEFIFIKLRNLFLSYRPTITPETNHTLLLYRHSHRAKVQGRQQINFNYYFSFLFLFSRFVLSSSFHYLYSFHTIPAPPPTQQPDKQRRCIYQTIPRQAKQDNQTSTRQANRIQGIIITTERIRTVQRAFTAFPASIPLQSCF